MQPAVTPFTLAPSSGALRWPRKCKERRDCHAPDTQQPVSTSRCPCSIFRPMRVGGRLALTAGVASRRHTKPTASNIIGRAVPRVSVIPRR
jgi:hypothetical protein